MPINFGTDGWRAVISDTFTFYNLRLVTQAIADAVISPSWNNGGAKDVVADDHKMVVGFDTRFLSDRYAREVARVLAGNDFSVMLSQADAPTPAISFAVRNMGAKAGVMITASHNAPRYNGVKLKSTCGNAASPEQCDRVEVYLNDNELQGRGPNLMDFQIAKNNGQITTFNPIPAYHDHLRNLIDMDVIADAKPRIVIDSMYGSGRGVIRGILQGTGCEVEEIRGDLNPGFGGIHPEPIGHYLDALATTISMGKGDFGLATDGDADRIGAMDGRGNFVDPHKIMALALKYLVEVRGLSGAVVRTISTSRMLDRLALKYGLKLYETPVGFNHISDYMLNEDILIGGEESGGISFKGHIPEGDGVLIGLLLTEIISYYRTPLYELVEQLLNEVGPAVYKRKDMRLKHPVAKDAMVRKLKNNAPASIGGESVTEIIDIDGIKYILSDDSWLLIRPSGTEPVLRVYAEGRSPEMVEALMGFGQEVASNVA
ncbi:MAG: phosphoglucomutase/phosphomannomutase family protein [Anaerolineaceae bacterium]|nr:phosphoglucomutase/phosphomannomutase family protein [Anaerolineaceae bacterium]